MLESRCLHELLHPVRALREEDKSLRRSEINTEIVPASISARSFERSSGLLLFHSSRATFTAPLFVLLLSKVPLLVLGPARTGC
jgi:hypothetical protein